MKPLILTPDGRPTSERGPAVVWQRLSRTPRPQVMEQVPTTGDVVAVVTGDPAVIQALLSAEHWNHAWRASAVLNGHLRYTARTLATFEWPAP